MLQSLCFVYLLDANVNLPVFLNAPRSHKVATFQLRLNEATLSSGYERDLPAMASVTCFVPTLSHDICRLLLTYFPSSANRLNILKVRSCLLNADRNRPTPPVQTRVYAEIGGGNGGAGDVTST